MKKVKYVLIFCWTVLLSCQDGPKSTETRSKIIHELNEREIRAGDKTIRLVGATLIDGKGGAPLENATVVIKNNIIESVGRSDEEDIPSDAEVIDVKGLTILP